MQYSRFHEEWQEARKSLRNARSFSALDEETAAQIEHDLMDAPGLGVIVVTHRLREAVRKKLTGVYTLKGPAP